jgi:hypothetical protein
MTEFEVIRLAVKIKPENMLGYKISMDWKSNCVLSSKKHFRRLECDSNLKRLYTIIEIWDRKYRVLFPWRQWTILQT